MREINNKLISAVIPIFNEQENILQLFDKLKSVLHEIGNPFEIIFVDDGSTDNSFSILDKLFRENEFVKIIKLSRNFGHQVAITAGTRHALGDLLIAMDADLQHPPSLIPKMLEKWKEGFDIVYTVKVNSGENFFKKWTAKIFYFLINKISDTPIISNAADFRLLDKKVYQILNQFKERSPFVRGLVQWVGFKSCGIPFAAEKRNAGVTKYSLRKMLSFAIDGILSFSTFPLRVATYLGIFIVVVNFIYTAIILFEKLFLNTPLTGWTSLIISILFLGSIQLITIGLVGEFVARIHNEVKGRPLYVIDQILEKNNHNEK